MKKFASLLFTATTLVACVGQPDAGDDGLGDDATGDDDPGTPDEWETLLGQRVLDYNAALRTAALRLTGDLPTMDESNTITAAPDDAAKKVAYETLLRNYVDRPTFAKQMFFFWRDVFKLGNTDGQTPEFDTAPAFAAQLSAENRSYMELFTATTNNCPTLDTATGVFTPATCPGTGPQAGVLANGGAMKQFFGNFAFRRVRWVQETFDCLKFPAEVGPATDVAGAQPFNKVWEFDSISGLDTGRVNFKDVSAVVCANCHQTLNHVAPLFANFDEDGVYGAAIAVPTPLDGAPKAEITDYYPAGQTTAWRLNKNAADITALGALFATDADISPSIAKCGVARVWNWALGKNDIVDTLTDVPLETVQTQLDAFTANQFKMKDLILAIYSSDDFVKFWGSTMMKNKLLLVAVASSLGFVGACVDNQLEGDDPQVGDPGTGGTTSGDPSNTFNHENDGISPWELVDRLTKEGPPRYTSHIHSCSKVRYANLENVLKSVGIDTANNGNLSAGQLYRDGINAMGAPNYANRIRENIGISTSGSSRLFDIFAAGATEVMTAVPTLQRCMVGGTPAQLFNGNACVMSGISCLIGAPATQSHLDICNASITLASTPDIGKRIAVATILAAAYTCE